MSIMNSYSFEQENNGNKREYVTKCQKKCAKVCIYKDSSFEVSKFRVPNRLESCRVARKIGFDSPTIYKIVSRPTLPCGSENSI